MGAAEDEPHWGTVCSDAYGATVEACVEWRRRLREDPSDVDARVRLVGAGFGSNDERIHEDRAVNLIWLHTHRPGIDLSEFGTTDHKLFAAEYAEVRDHFIALLTQRPDDLLVLKRAALFVELAEPREAVLVSAWCVAQTRLEWARLEHGHTALGKLVLASSADLEEPLFQVLRGLARMT